jgi:GWxTD domain-containing protein
MVRKIKIITLLLIVFLLQLSSLEAINASIGYVVFKGPDGPYVEVTTYIMGNSVLFESKEESSALKQSIVEVIILIKDGEQIIAYDKSRLRSPLSENRVNFSDVKRILVPEGEYVIEVQLSDLVAGSESMTFKEALSVKFNQEIDASGVQLLGSFRQADEENKFVKHGIHMEELPFSYYNKNYKILAFYQEVYLNNYPAEHYLYRYALSRLNSQNEKVEVLAHYKKRKSQEIDPIFYQLDLSQIQSGDYYLSIRVEDLERNVLSEKEVFFIRSNPEYDYEKTLKMLSAIDDKTNENFTESLDSTELRYSLRALMPLISQSEAEVLKIIISKAESHAMRQYLNNHFQNAYPDNPKLGYDRYMEVARAVDKMYNSGFGFGFEMDRGYFFLKYGKPDDMQIVNDDPTAPPYEIWLYNKLMTTNQSNVKFIFYNPTLVHNGHVLLHSTARGEWNNPKWETMLYKNAPNERQGDNYMDGNRMQDNWNRHARRFFDDF